MPEESKPIVIPPQSETWVEIIKAVKPPAPPPPPPQKITPTDKK